MEWKGEWRDFGKRVVGRGEMETAALLETSNNTYGVSYVSTYLHDSCDLTSLINETVNVLVVYVTFFLNKINVEMLVFWVFNHEVYFCGWPSCKWSILRSLSVRRLP